MPTIHYIDCRCCGNQFTNKHDDDPSTFVCGSCDAERLAHNAWLDRMEVECGWFSAPDER